LSGARTEDEGLFVIQHSQWAERMRTAIKDERALISNPDDVAAE
jgi:benzoate/toluate 1,2-dioxygenase alpha subunit